MVFDLAGSNPAADVSSLFSPFRMFVVFWWIFGVSVTCTSARTPTRPCCINPHASIFFGTLFFSRFWKKGGPRLPFCLRLFASRAYFFEPCLLWDFEGVVPFGSMTLIFVWKLYVSLPQRLSFFHLWGLVDFAWILVVFFLLPSFVVLFCCSYIRPTILPCETILKGTGMGYFRKVPWTRPFAYSEQQCQLLNRPSTKLSLRRQ